MRVTIKVPEASRVTGIPQATLRKWLRQGKVPYGRAVPKGKTASGNPGFNYVIYLPKLMQEMGLTEWPEEARQ